MRDICLGYGSSRECYTCHFTSRSELAVIGNRVMTVCDGPGNKRRAVNLNDTCDDYEPRRPRRSRESKPPPWWKRLLSSVGRWAAT